ncbi:Phage protein [Bacillus thuringiensis serovar israelensis ATCC 35646]|nr:Phage protein [Bacillus thuringiensis serovar israelensis ATCC 35646]
MSLWTNSASLYYVQGYKHHHIDNEMDIWHYLRLNQKYREQDHSNSGNQNSNEMEVRRKHYLIRGKISIRPI